MKRGDEASSSEKVDVGLSLLCFVVSLTCLKVQKKIPDHISAPGLGVLGGVGPTGLVGFPISSEKLEKSD